MARGRTHASPTALSLGDATHHMTTFGLRGVADIGGRVAKAASKHERGRPDAKRFEGQPPILEFWRSARLASPTCFVCIGVFFQYSSSSGGSMEFSSPNLQSKTVETFGLDSSRLMSEGGGGALPQQREVTSVPAFSTRSSSPRRRSQIRAGFSRGRGLGVLRTDNALLRILVISALHDLVLAAAEFYFNIEINQRACTILFLFC